MTDFAKIEATQESLFIVTMIVTIEKDISSEKYIDLTGVIPVPDIGWYYTQAEGFSESIPASVTVKRRYLDPINFYLGRLTNDERGKMFALMDADGGGVTLDIVQRGRLKAFIMLTVANRIPLDHKETVFIINALETAGAFAAGRAAEILG